MDTITPILTVLRLTSPVVPDRIHKLLRLFCVESTTLVANATCVPAWLTNTFPIQLEELAADYAALLARFRFRFV